MVTANIPENDEDRVRALQELRILDTPPEERFDRIIRLAQAHYQTAAVLISLVDSDRQWFKARCGLDTCETPRDVSFCGHAILENDVLVIADTTNDPRFADNPLVTGDPKIRFYAGCPLKLSNGHTIGTLCLIDPTPREPGSFNGNVLQDLAAIVVEELEMKDIIGLQKKLLEATDEVRRQNAENERLLLNVLPGHIATRLKNGEENIADKHPQVTVLFSDIIGFTEWAHRTEATKMVTHLNELFSEFDLCAHEHGMEKIKTIGDAYMAVSGLSAEDDDHANSAAGMALSMFEALKRFNQQNDLSFELRIGIHTGSAMAGVIGRHKFIYDLWGDTVNVASRMENSAPPNSIQLSSTTCDALEDKFAVEGRGEVTVKGRGAMTTFLLKGR